MTVLIGSYISSMLRLKCPATEVHDESPVVSTTATGAGVYATVSPYRSPRKWRLGVGVAAPHEMQALTDLTRYLWETGPWVFVSEWASGTNGLTPAQSALRPETLPSGVTRAGRVQVRDVHGEYVTAWSVTCPVSQWTLDGSGTPTPVVGGEPVTISAAYLEDGSTAPKLGVQWLKWDGTVLSTDVAAAPAPVEVITASTVIGADTVIVASGGLVGSVTAQPLVRRWRTLTAPADARAARLVFAGATTVAAPAITLTDGVSSYGPGDGCPQVVPTQHSIDMILNTVPTSMSSYDFEVQELGLALR